MDIAKASGVSRTTVTQVINQALNARISESTRQRVMQHARKMGYTQPQKDSNLKSPLIAYILCGVSNIDEPYIDFLNLLQNIALRDNRVTVFMTTTSDMESIKQVMYSIDNIKPLGIVLDGRIPDILLIEIEKREIPFVIVGATRYAYDPAFHGKINTVGTDIKGATREILLWFYTKGARRISISIGPLNLLTHKAIYEAYQKTVNELGLPYDPSLVQIGEESSGREIIERLGSLGIKFDAIMLGSVNRARRAIPYLRPIGKNSYDKNLIGVFGPTEQAEFFPEDVMFCGPSMSETCKQVYQLMAKEINYSQKKKQNLIIPCSMRGGSSSHLW